MKLKISDEELDEIWKQEKAKGNTKYTSEMNYRTFHNIGFRAAQSHHQSKVDKLMQIVEMQREALEKLLPEVYCLYKQNNGERLDKVPEKHDSVKIKYDNAKESICETDEMMKELKDGK